MRLGFPTLLPILPLGSADQGFSTHRITSPFGWRDLDGDGKATEFHGGLDIGNFRAGDILIATAPGVVEAVGNLGLPWSQPTSRWPSGNYGGLMAVIRHPNGAYSIYAHMRRCYLTKGQTVTTGTRVGEIGDSGSASGQAHVHFGVQAPRHLIPDGLAFRATTFGIGIDVDPAPLIFGSKELIGSQEDDMPLTFSAEGVTRVEGAPMFKTTVDAWFRSAPERGDQTQIAVLKAGSAFAAAVTVPGEQIGDNADWLEARAWAAGKYRLGYIHSSVVERVETPAPAPVVTGLSEEDVTREVDAALKQANETLDAWVATRPTFG